MGLRIYRADDEKHHDIDPAEENLLGQFIPLHYHFNMLQDASRVDAFRRAIEMLVEPGMRVLELGGGTGILSFFAARRGAEVECVERNPELVQASRHLLRQNEVAREVRVVEADAFTYLPSEPVDVVICEMLHVAMLREKQLEVLASFKQRYTARFGPKLPRFIPDSSLLAVQPIEHTFDFFGYHAPVPLFQAPATEHERTRALAELSPYAAIAYDEDFPTTFNVDGTFTIEHPGRLTALRFTTQNLVAVDAQRGEGITWPNQFLVLPVAAPQDVDAGQQLRVRFNYQAGATLASLADSMSVELASQRRAA